VSKASDQNGIAAIRMGKDSVIATRAEIIATIFLAALIDG
jgi:hypothetical protein